MAVNQSKKRDPRFWGNWERSGAVGRIIVRIISAQQQDYIDQARSWLEAVRKPSSNTTDWIHYVWDFAKMAGVNLEFLGTSEKELGQLTIDGHIAEARFWLEALRKPSYNGSSCAGYIRQYAEKAGVTLEFLGTSEDELQRLIIAGHIVEAKRWIRWMRKPTPNKVDCAQYVRQHAENAGVTLEFLGTSAVELRQYAPA